MWKSTVEWDAPPSGRTGQAQTEGSQEGEPSCGTSEAQPQPTRNVGAQLRCGHQLRGSNGSPLTYGVESTAYGSKSGGGAVSFSIARVRFS